MPPPRSPRVVRPLPLGGRRVRSFYTAQHVDANGAGTFTITAAFAGNAGLLPSQAGPCTTTSP